MVVKLDGKLPVIRRATRDDVDALAELIDRTVVQSNAPDYPPATLAELRAFANPARLLELMADRECFVAVAGGRIVGTISLGGERLRQMYVAPEIQKGGLGRQLVEFLEAHARAQGIAELALHSSLTARGFYERMGYRMIEYLPQGVPTWLMTKRLSP